MTTYSRLRDASIRDVLTHFIECEMTREKYATQIPEIKSWYSLRDDEFLARLKEFANRRDDDNPILTWTVGTKDNKHFQRVKAWKLVTAPIQEFYSRSVNKKINPV